MAKQAITAYGFDCTAASLHVGSLLPTMMLHWLRDRPPPIALMGGGTTVGDLSGKDERRILTDDDIKKPQASAVFSKFLKFRARRQRRDGGATGSTPQLHRFCATSVDYSVNRMLSDR